MSLPERCFSKMHGAGNDFVVLDLRQGHRAPSIDEARLMADRRRGIGCDQLLTIEPPTTAGAVAAYRIWNADGSAAGQCGNGARCVAAWLVRDGSASGERFTLDSPAGPIGVEALADGSFRLDMGRPRFAPADVPLVMPLERPLYSVDSPFGELHFGAVSMGNPHAVIEVASVDEAQVADIGRWLQGSSWFPEGINVGFAQRLSPDAIRLRVFERGAGETLACGSGACAAVAVLVRQGRIGRSASVALPGGELRIDWPDDAAPLSMAGPAAFVFEGEWKP